MPEPGPEATAPLGAPTLPLYPVFLRLAGVPVVVVGAGPVAAQKLGGLLAAGARVTVIAPAVCAEVRAAQSGAGGGVSGGVIDRILERAFEPRDLDGARWVVAAAPPAVNRAVAAAAAARGLFVNAVDDPDAATAYLGGVIRRGAVEIAISTGGLAPALAGLLREALDAVLPRELDTWIATALRERAAWRRAGVPMVERRPLLLRALERLYEPAPRAAAGELP
jgi:uroporphyrin-III C-methyltransferase/precorrin-2 dehydrogenase/sirohydrochlorin ferrochelatase